MNPAIFSNKYFRVALIAIPAFLALSASYFRLFESYELQTYDWRCQLRVPRPMSRDIVLIDIADDSLEKLGHWPFSREYHSALIDILGKFKVRSALFDILFVEPSDKDVTVINSARSKKNVFFCAAFMDPKWEKGKFVSKSFLAPLIEGYRTAARGVGFVNVKADPDGKRRRVIPSISMEGKDYYHLGFEAAIDILGIDKSKIKVDPGHSIRFSDNLTIPLDGDGYFLVNFANRWKDAFEHYSYSDVLTSYVQILDHEKPVVDLKRLKGKICFVGFTATGSTDTNATPLEPIYPMMGIHANVLNSILQKDFIRRADRVTNILILILLVSWIFYLSLHMKPIAAFRSMILTLFLFTICVVFLFFHWGIWLDLFYPLALAIAIYTVATLSRMLYEMKKRELIENELKVASQIQKSFLPSAVPDHAGLDIAVYMKPAKAVGGDLYTFIPLADSKLGVMLGDVSGKGTPAALFMAKAVSEFKFSAREQNNPSDVLLGLNHSIASESTGGLFVTLAYVIFDVKSRNLCISNGGHLPTVHVSALGQTELLNAEGGMPIGVLDGVTFDKFEMEIKPGDCFALYSDGVSEARNRKKEEFGIETLQKVIQDNRNLNAQGILDSAVNRLNQFMGKADQHDDITLLIVKVGALSDGK